MAESVVMTPEQHFAAMWLLGPWLIGAFIDIFLQGILSTQFVHYWNWYRDDKIGLRLAVVGLMLMTYMKTVQTIALTWLQFIDTFVDIDTASMLSYTHWLATGNPLMVASIGFYVQAYFCYRLFAISKSAYVVVPVAVILVFAYVSICAGTFYITLQDGDRIAMWFACHLGSVFAGDVIMSATTALFLIKAKKNVLPQTVGLLTALVRLTFQTAAPAAICAMLNLIFSQIYGDDRIVSTAFNQTLAKLYAVSMMWTLNARRDIRAVLSSQNGMTGQMTSDGNLSRRRGHDVELGAISGIQVRTHMETVQHIDVRDMFDHQQSKATKIDEESLQHKSDDFSIHKS